MPQRPWVLIDHGLGLRAEALGPDRSRARVEGIGRQRGRNGRHGCCCSDGGACMLHTVGPLVLKHMPVPRAGGFANAQGAGDAGAARPVAISGEQVVYL